MNISNLGPHRDTASNRLVEAFQIQETPAYGEERTQYITISKLLEGGTHGSGESGLWPQAHFLARFAKVPNKH